MIVDGEVIEADPPHKLVQTWRMAMDPRWRPRASRGSPTRSSEGARRREPAHRDPRSRRRAGTPRWSRGDSEDQGAGGGWPWILSDLKSLLETGSSFTGA